MSSTRAWAIAAALLGLAVAGPSAAASAHRPAPETFTVTIDKMAFSPAKLDARVGDVVVFVNKDFLRHTATAAGAFDLDLAPGASSKAVLKTAGLVKYVCRYHPGMTGQIQVAAKP
jgi:plastocyanin